MKRVVSEKGETLTIDMSADYVQINPWDARPQDHGGRFSGSFQVLWEGTDVVGASWKWQVSNDGYNWDDWTGSLCVDNTIIVDFEPPTDVGIQSYEVLYWPYKFYRFNYTKGPATVGEITINLHRNK
jgi:hypothetical protein